jgi:uncharacterized RDD family membrane protein YckC
VNPEPQPDEARQTITRYATFTRRFRALVIDSAIIAGVVAALVIGGDLANAVPGYGRIAWLLMFGAVFLYEPVLVWRRGSTVGHAMNHLIVVNERTNGRPTLWQAVARYVLKLLLGIPSFVTMSLTRKHQAAHDSLTKTTVRIRAGMTLAPGDFHLERDNGNEVLPSRVRRGAVMAAYLVALFVAYAVLLSAADPQGCVRDESCPTGVRLLTDAITLGWFGACLATIVATWKGRLLGARRRPQSESGALVVSYDASSVKSVSKE